MRGSTSSTYWTPSTVTRTCAMSPSSSPGTTTHHDAVRPDLPWIGARDHAPRPCGGEHIPAPIFGIGKERTGPDRPTERPAHTSGRVTLQERTQVRIGNPRTLRWCGVPCPG